MKFPGALTVSFSFITTLLAISFALTGCILGNPDERTPKGNGDVYLGLVKPMPGESARALARQSDGKILASISHPGVSDGVRRFASDFSVDRTFGTDGTAGIEMGLGLIPQSDGKFVVQTWSPRCPNGLPYIDGCYSLERHLGDGSIDASFGVNGYVNTDIGSHSRHDTHTYPLQLQNSNFGVQPDGQLLVGGMAIWFANWGDGRGMVERFTVDGAVDPTFGTNGQARSPERIDYITTLTGGEIRGGYTYSWQLTPWEGWYSPIPSGNSKTEDDVALYGFTRDGAADGSFGNQGSVLSLARRGYNLNSIAHQSNGKIVLGGSRISGETFVLVRLNQDGSLDATFGTGGVLDTGITAFSRNSHILVRPDDHIVLAGNGYFMGEEHRVRVILIQATADGKIDESFAHSGHWLGGLNPNYLEFIQGLELDDDGSLIVLANGLDKSNGIQPRWDSNGFAIDAFFLARFRPDGSLIDQN